MRSCIGVLYIALFCIPVAAAQGLPRRIAEGAEAGDPDALYRDRTNLPSARQAAALWETRLTANPRDFKQQAQQRLRTSVR